MNILVSKFYTVSDHSKWYNDRSSEENLEQNYEAMKDILIESAKRHLIDLDDVIIHTDIVKDIRHGFVKHFEEIYELWKQGHNILYCDLDVVFTKPIRVFGEFSDFMMFNHTDPRSTTHDKWNLRFGDFFNCGVRYYPQSMEQSVWDIGIARMKNFDYERWDSEQVVYNEMMWSQTRTVGEDDTKTKTINSVEHYHNPHFAYQLLNYPPTPQLDEWNGCALKDAAIVHVHGSRGSADRLAIMHELNNGEISILARVYWRNHPSKPEELNCKDYVLTGTKADIDRRLKFAIGKYGYVKVETAEVKDEEIKAQSSITL